MNSTDFLRGMCVGAIVGAAVEMMVMPRPRAMKTSVGKTMQAMGNAMDNAVESISHNIGM